MARLDTGVVVFDAVEVLDFGMAFHVVEMLHGKAVAAVSAKYMENRRGESLVVA